MFHDLNILVNIKTLVTKINKNELIEIGKIVNNLPIKYWSLLEFIPLNKGEINQSSFLLEPKKFDEICAKIKEQFPLIRIQV